MSVVRFKMWARVHISFKDKVLVWLDWEVWKD